MGAAIETTESAVDDQPVGKTAGTDDDNARARKESLETADGDRPRKTLDENQSVNKSIESDDDNRANEIAHSYLENLRVDLKKDPSLNATTIDKIVSIFQRNFAVNAAHFYFSFFFAFKTKFSNASLSLSLSVGLFLLLYFDKDYIRKLGIGQM